MTEIKHIVNEIERGNIRIPEFQRSYTWDRPKATLLMHSLYREYPIGIITFWTQQDQNDRSVRMIVDGQQRLTTIYACFKDTAPPRQRASKRELPIGMHFSPKQEIFKFPTRADRREDHTWIKVSHALQDDDDTIADWEKNMEADGASREERRRYNQRIRRLASVRDREIKEQEINANLESEEVIEIFDRINAQGKRLTRGELEMAWISVKCTDARDRITKEVNHWTSTPMEKAINEESIIRSMAAVHTGRYHTDSHKGKTFKGSGPTSEQILEALSKVETAHQAIHKLLVERLRIADHRAVPSSATFTIISKFLSRNGNRFTSASDEAKALAYHLTATGWGIYHGSTQTQIDGDLQAVDEENPWEALYRNACAKLGVSEVTTDPARFLVRRTSSDRFFCVIEMLRRAKDVLDWHTKIPIREYGHEELDAHHIFPRIHLEARSTRAEQLDNIANITLLTKETNLKIRDRAPEAYLAEIDDQDEKLLRAHGIPRNRDLWKIENYEKFLEERRGLMAEKTDEMIGKMRQGILP